MQTFQRSTAVQNAFPQHRSLQAQPIHEAIARQELQASLARHRALKQQQNRKEQWEYLVGYWPVALGIALACISPLLKTIVEPFKEWGMGIVFPFVALASRSELHMSTTVPEFMLFAQFPLEGLLARIAFKGPTTFKAGTLRMAYCHGMAAVLLLLLSGVLTQYVR